MRERRGEIMKERDRSDIWEENVEKSISRNIYARTGAGGVKCLKTEPMAAWRAVKRHRISWLLVLFSDETKIKCCKGIRWGQNSKWYHVALMKGEKKADHLQGEMQKKGRFPKTWRCGGKRWGDTRFARWDLHQRGGRRVNMTEFSRWKETRGEECRAETVGEERKQMARENYRTNKTSTEEEAKHPWVKFCLLHLSWFFTTS